MMMSRSISRPIQLSVLLGLMLGSAQAKLVVNEVADKGAGSDVCNGEDYIELKNIGSSTVDPSGYTLADSKGPKDGDAYTFPAGSAGIDAGAFLLLCKVKDFAFGIGGTDTVTLFDSNEKEVSTTGALTGEGSETSSLQRKPGDIDSYKYSVPTPGEPNGLYKVVVNEVGDKGTFNTCGGDNANTGEDYVELLNLSNDEVDISGFILSDDKGPQDGDVLVFPANSFIGAGDFLVLCKNAEGSFAFGIGGDDTVSLFDADSDLVSTSGVLKDIGSPSLSFQRKVDGTYDYASPTPGEANDQAKLVVNEVADKGAGSDVCNGEDYIELKNIGSSTVDPSGYTLADSKGPKDGDAYTFPAGSAGIDAGAFLLLCKVKDFAFGIGGTDTVTLFDSNEKEVSTTGALTGEGSETSSLQRKPGDIDSYKYSVPTPGKPNGFSFPALSPTTSPSTSPTTSPTSEGFVQSSPTISPTSEANFIQTSPPTSPTPAANSVLQECGIATEPYGAVSDYKYVDTIEVGGNPREFSGGSFYGVDCTHWIFGDEGFATEFNLANLPAVEELRRIPLVGGSGDTEGSCFYTDESTGVTKIAYVDERERSVALCDIPTAGEEDVIYRDSSSCRVIGLTPEQFDDTTLTSSVPNEGFEGVACDPGSQKLYVIQEKNPMKIWTVDLVTETFSEQIDVQGLASWTNQVTDLAGVAFNPIDRTLYVLSQESKLVLQSTLTGELIGGSLDLSIANQPEGIHFVPSTGEMWISSEPNELLQFSVTGGRVTGSSRKMLRRRLLDSSVDELAAEKATGDLEMAEIGAY